MTVSITKPAGGLFYLEGDGYCFVSEESFRKEAILSPQPLYLLDSDETDVFDYGGTIKTGNLSGIYVGVSAAACKQFISDGEALISGHQDTDSNYPLDFASEFRDAMKIKIMDFESTKESGAPLIVRWTLKVVQSSTNA